MAENQSMIFYYEWLDTLDMLPPDKFIETFKAVVNLARNGEATNFDDISQKIAYQFIANQIKRDKEKYQNTVKKRAEAGRKGGLAKQANARFAKQIKQSLANLADNGDGSDNGDVNGCECVNDTDDVGECDNIVYTFRTPTHTKKEEALQCNEETSQNNGNDVTLLRREREEKEKYKETEKRESKAYQSPTHTSDLSKFGKFQNILLSPEQVEDLNSNYPGWENTMNKLSTHMESSGKTYQSHYATIIKWYEQDHKKEESYENWRGGGPRLGLDDEVNSESETADMDWLDELTAGMEFDER